MFYLVSDNDNGRKSSYVTKNDQKKTWYLLRNDVITLAINKFKDVSGFECLVDMMEQSIQSYKTDLYDYKLLSNSYQIMADLFAYQNDFQNNLQKDLKDESKKKKMERARENVLNPQYFCIKFGPIADNSWLRFLSRKTFVYRGDTTLRSQLS